MNKTVNNKTAQDLKYVDANRITELEKVFQTLGIEFAVKQYPGADQFSRELQKSSALIYEGVEFSISGSTTSPFAHK